MPYETTIYRREELYEQIWTMPVSEVAKKYGVSDVALAKVCRKLNVPRPSRGYWARKAAGQKVSPAPLPPMKPNEVAEYKVSKWKYPPPPEPSAEELAFRARFAPPRVDLPFNVAIKAALDRPHRMVAATMKALRKATPDRDGLCSPYGENCLPIKISKEQGNRAGRFLDALLKAVEKAGQEVRSAEGYASPARFIVDGEEIEGILASAARLRLDLERFIQWFGTEGCSLSSTAEAELLSALGAVHDLAENIGIGLALDIEERAGQRVEPPAAPVKKPRKLPVMDMEPGETEEACLARYGSVARA